MPAFNLEHEQRRLAEQGISPGAKVVSVKDNLRTLVFERTHTPSFFALTARADEVTSVGYEHRGDLSNSFVKSEEEAPTARIEARYALENEGYRKAREQFFKLPLHSTIMLISPPPDEPIPGYPGHTPIYFYHILPGQTQDEREIKALSWDVWLSKDDQAQILNGFNPDTRVLPTEESILTSPISVSGGEGTQSFHAIWNSLREYFRKKGYTHFAIPSGLVMEQYLLHGSEIMRNQHLELDVMMESLAQRLASGATRNEIADDFDTMLGRGDKDLLHKDWGHQQTMHMDIPRHTIPDRPPAFAVFQQNKYLGENVRQVMTFCGMSTGMKTTPFGPPKEEAPVNTWSFTAKRGIAEDKENNVAQEQTRLCCTCPFCSREVEAVIGGGKITCPDCKASVPWSQQSTKTQ